MNGWRTSIGPVKVRFYKAKGLNLVFFLPFRAARRRSAARFLRARSTPASEESSFLCFLVRPFGLNSPNPNFFLKLLRRLMVDALALLTQK